MGGDVKQIISLSILGIVGLLVLIGALKGLTRGIKRQTIRTVTIVLSIVLSCFAVRASYSAILGFFEDRTIQDIFTILEKYGVSPNAGIKDMLACFDNATFQYILAIPLALLIGPVTFTLIFIIVSALMLIVHAIICGIVGFRKKQNNHLTRLLGMILGAAQGVLVSIVLLVPIIGIANTVSGAVDTIRQNENKSESEVQLIDMYDNQICDIAEGPVVKILGKFGGNIMYDMLATIKVENNSVKMVEEMNTVILIYGEAGTLGSADFKNLTAEQQASLRTVIDTLCESDYFALLLSNFLKGAAGVLENGMVSEMQEPVKTILVDVLAIFKTVSQETIEADLDTFCNLYFLFIDEGVIGAADGSGTGNSDDDVIDVLFKKNAEGKTTIDRAIGILDANTRTKPIITSLVKISVAYAKENLKDSASGFELGSQDIEQVYTSVKTTVNEIIKIDRNSYTTDEEYKGAVSSSLESMVIDNGFVEQSFIEENREEMDKIFSDVSDHIITEYEGKEEVSDAELIDIIIQYYDSYSNGTFDGSSAAPEGLPEGAPEDVPAN